MGCGQLRVSKPLHPGQPLWKRVPSRDCDGLGGRLLADFMMLIPRLSSRSEERLKATVEELQGVFDYYREVVVFADLNLRLNLLWVSVRPVPGVTLELAAALKLRVPEAMLVANKAEATMAVNARGG